MKRPALVLSALCVTSLLSGCCFPGYNWWSPWGCQQGGCAPQQYGPAAGPVGYNPGYDSVAAYPTYSTIAAQPVMTTPVATVPQAYPTIAVESLPTYR